jgi:beta-glucosidase
MSHARATALYNRDFKATQKGKIGISLNGDYYEPWDSQDERDQQAAERRMEFHIGWFANPVWYVFPPALPPAAYNNVKDNFD